MSSAKRIIAGLLSEYTGRTLRADQLLVCEDGVVESCYAVMINLSAGKKEKDLSGFLVYLPDHFLAGTAGEIEEVEFKQWPPKNRRS